MTNKELEEKAQHYADCVEKEYNIPERIKRLIKNAYIVGANERLSIVWHSIDDEPTGNYDIICKDKTTYWACSWEYFYDNYPNWAQFVEAMNVEKWLYMHEL